MRVVHRVKLANQRAHTKAWLVTWAGNPEQAEGLERALAPVLASGILETLLGALGLLRLLRARGAPVLAPWEAALLEALLVLVTASHHARAQLAAGPDPDRCGLLVRPLLAFSTPSSSALANAGWSCRLAADSFTAVITFTIREARTASRELSRLHCCSGLPLILALLEKDAADSMELWP